MIDVLPAALRAFRGHGFGVARADVTLDLSAYGGFRLRANDVASRAALRVWTSECTEGVYYEAPFALEVPFAAFASGSENTEYPGHPPFDPARITALGVVVYGTTQFELVVHEWSAVGEPSALAAPNAWDEWALRELSPLGRSFDRKEQRIDCYQTSAIVRAEYLFAYEAAMFARTQVRRRESVVACEAALFAIMEAAYELSVAQDLAAETNDYFAREDAARVVFDRYAELESSLRASLSAAGLRVP